MRSNIAQIDRTFAQTNTPQFYKYFFIKKSQIIKNCSLVSNYKKSEEKNSNVSYEDKPMILQTMPRIFIPTIILKMNYKKSYTNE